MVLNWSYLIIFVYLIHGVLVKFFNLSIVVELLLLKLFVYIIYNSIIFLIIILIIPIIYLLSINNIYIYDYRFKLEKIKNFSFLYSIFIFLFVYMIYILFFSINNNVFIASLPIYAIISRKSFIFNLDLTLGIDTITIFFLLLTSLIFIFIFFYLNFFKKNYYIFNEFNKYNDIFVILYFIYFFLFLTFLSLNFFYFFIFFESSLMCLYLLINFGGLKKKKYYASFSLFFFTTFGSILILTSIIILFINFKTLDIEILINEKIDLNLQKLLSILLFFGFAVKIPILPFYNWLPEAHVEASAVGSVLLASILLKIGSYGILRFMLPILKEGIFYFYNFFYVFCIISIIISCFLAIFQNDLKKIIAYSSITHMNYMVIGLLSYDIESIKGAVLYMISHAFISTGLFFIIGIIYDSMGSREMLNLGNLNFYNPILTIFLFLLSFSNVAFPLTSSYIAEILILANIIKINIFMGLLLLMGLFFSSIYSLWFIHSVVYNKLYCNNKVVSIVFEEIILISTILVLILFFGIFPTLFLSDLEQNLIGYLKHIYTL